MREKHAIRKRCQNVVADQNNELRRMEAAAARVGWRQNKLTRGDETAVGKVSQSFFILTLSVD